MRLTYLLLVFTILNSNSKKTDYNIEVVDSSGKVFCEIKKNQILKINNSEPVEILFTDDVVNKLRNSGDTLSGGRIIIFSKNHKPFSIMILPATQQLREFRPHVCVEKRGLKFNLVLLPVYSAPMNEMQNDLKSSDEIRAQKDLILDYEKIIKEFKEIIVQLKHEIE